MRFVEEFVESCKVLYINRIYLYFRLIEGCRRKKYISIFAHEKFFMTMQKV